MKIAFDTDHPEETVQILPDIMAIQSAQHFVPDPSKVCINRLGPQKVGPDLANPLFGMAKTK